MSNVMSNDGLDHMFRKARTHSAWLDKPVTDELLRQFYDLAKLGPTSANMSPMRIVFVKRCFQHPAESTGAQPRCDHVRNVRRDRRRPGGGVLLSGTRSQVVFEDSGLEIDAAYFCFAR